MLVPFDQLPEEARIWIYPSDRPFRSDEILQLEQALSDFLAQWTAHNQSLEAGFVLPHDRFIVIGINQETAHASGCSIDSSVRFIQELEEKFEIVLLDKMNVTFKQGDYFVHKQLSDFRKMAKSRIPAPLFHYIDGGNRQKCGRPQRHVCISSGPRRARVQRLAQNPHDRRHRDL